MHKLVMNMWRRPREKLRISRSSKATSLTSPQGRQVAADVANYATGGAVVIHYPVQYGAG